MLRNNLLAAGLLSVLLATSACSAANSTQPSAAQPASSAPAEAPAAAAADPAAPAADAADPVAPAADAAAAADTAAPALTVQLASSTERIVKTVLHHGLHLVRQHPRRFGDDQRPHPPQNCRRYRHLQ